MNSIRLRYYRATTPFPLNKDACPIYMRRLKLVNPVAFATLSMNSYSDPSFIDCRAHCVAGDSSSRITSGPATKDNKVSLCRPYIQTARTDSRPKLAIVRKFHTMLITIFCLIITGRSAESVCEEQ